jgi:hypothetical protein
MSRLELKQHLNQRNADSLSTPCFEPPTFVNDLKINLCWRIATVFVNVMSGFFLVDAVGLVWLSLMRCLTPKSFVYEHNF